MIFLYTKVLFCIKITKHFFLLSIYIQKISFNYLKIDSEILKMIANVSMDLNAQENKKDLHYNAKEDFSPPPFIGCLISDKDGIRIASFEVYKGALEFNIKRNMKDKSRCEHFDVDLISMYFCAFRQVSFMIFDWPKWLYCCISFKSSNIRMTVSLNISQNSLFSLKG